MWEDRFATPDYVFGTEPSQFLKSQAHLLQAGQTALAIADGEGRNSVYMADLGLQVTAMDSAANGVAKARKLAQDKGVSVDFRQADLRGWDWSAGQYDVIAAIFFQFAEPAFRAQIFDGIEAALKPGGLLLLHGYEVRQLGFGTGGPKEADQLYTTQMLEERFGHWDVLSLRDYDAVLQEGQGHSGPSALVDLVARRPA
ncbi:MAG: class I SAM-dependent methyltransferase [Pseudomonadota bacterium]|nr:class I SAM-dependent methyltransferase [Pseudomonadota bacterium]MEE3071260.1 class I SAM-dependent methyltransferase [Pseudomonadota bacterium]